MYIYIHIHSIHIYIFYIYLYNEFYPLQIVISWIDNGYIYGIYQWNIG